MRLWRPRGRRLEVGGGVSKGSKPRGRSSALGGCEASGGRGVAGQKAAMGMRLPAILDDEPAVGLKDLMFLFFGMPGGDRLVWRAM